MVAIEIKLWFLGSLEHFWPDPKEKIHKVFKNKAQGCSTPLKRLTTGKNEKGIPDMNLPWNL